MTHRMSAQRLWHPRGVADVDVLIIGAGLSGIGAACHLTRERSETTYLIVEARDALGGTWDLFRYPGVRSDSDMFTYGYSFRPWPGPRSIASGDAILSYLQDTAQKYDLHGHIRLGHRVISAAWSSTQAQWTVQIEQTATDEMLRMTARFLWGNTGYYRYDHGHTADIPGLDQFAGDTIHPQHWPTDFDPTGKRIVVIGSGATAITLVPELARSAEHVTMLQRTPSYVASLPANDPLAQRLDGRVPSVVASKIVRAQNIVTAQATYRLSRASPKLLKKILRDNAAKHLPQDYDVQEAFEPAYDPWDQRLCVTPDHQLFDAISTGNAEVITSTIDKGVPDGVRLHDGRRIEADAIVTATGLEVLVLGGITFTVDDTPVDPADCLLYRGMMLSGLPNLAMSLGYTVASWTLESDLTAAHVCRLLAHMDRHGYRSVTPTLPPAAAQWDLAPPIDYSSGYIVRARAKLPSQGPVEPWRVSKRYLHDVLRLRVRSVSDPALRFT